MSHSMLGLFQRKCCRSHTFSRRQSCPLQRTVKGFFGLSVLLFIGAWRFDKYRCFIIDLHLQKFGFFDNYKSLEVHGYWEMPHRVCNTFQTLLSHRHRSPLRDCAVRGTGRLVLATLKPLKPTKLSNTPRSLLILHLLWGLLHHILAPTTA